MTRVMEIVETQVVHRLEQTRMVALAEIREPDQAEVAGAALVRGGIDCLELQSPSMPVLRAAARVEGLLVGAGNVHDAATAEAAERAGADFATAPGTNVEVI